MAKQPDAAITFLQNEISSHPQSALLYQELGQVYLWQQKRSAAIPVLQKALSLAPADPATTVLLPDAYAAENKNDQAARLLAEAMRTHAADAGLMLRAGMIFEKLQQWDKARGAYQGAVDADGDNALAKNNLAWLLAERGGNIDLALSLAQQAKQKLPDDPRITSTHRVDLLQKGRFQNSPRLPERVR